MLSKRIIGLTFVTIGILGLVTSVSLFGVQRLGHGGWAAVRSMMGRMGSHTNPSGSRISIDQAIRVSQDYLGSLANPDLAIDEIMEFQYNFYVIYYEKSTGIRAFEMLIDPYTGRIFPEYGPNMMWNTKYGMMGGMMGGRFRTSTANIPVTKDQAAAIAENYLKKNVQGTSTEEPDVFYGYYTIHIVKDGKIYGMLSVNGYNAQVWYHSWHGQFVQMKGFG
jgi:hypothetical protein